MKFKKCIKNKKPCLPKTFMSSKDLWGLPPPLPSLKINQSTRQKRFD